jgi:hypothetical protein
MSRERSVAPLPLARQLGAEPFGHDESIGGRPGWELDFDREETTELAVVLCGAMAIVDRVLA